MKILFTGCTAKQTDDSAYLRARVKRIDDSSIICNSLRKQGNIVDRKKVKWDEDLSEYDLAIVGLGSFGSNNYSGEILNALHAINKVKNILIFYEDWKIHFTYNSFAKMLEDDNFNKTISKKWSNGENFYGGVDNEYFDKNIALEVIKNIVDGKYDSLIPAFDWGNKQIVRDIIKSKNIYNLDLTPYVLEDWNIPTVVETKEKLKKHMLASLVDHRPWVKKNKLKWEVDYFGTKSIDDCPMLASETEVFEKCGEYWGILCPEYIHSGSGWFRIRYIYAAIHKSIIVTSKNDLKALNLPNYKVEELSDLYLNEYANEQSSKILSYMWDKDTFDLRLNNIINNYKK